MIGERRRPALPPELVARVGMIWLGVALLQVLSTLLAAWLGGGRPGLGLVGILPVAALFALFVLVARIAYRVFDEEIAGLACLACALAMPLMAVLRPAALDAHAGQVLAMLVAVNGLMARDGRRGGWTIGAALAAWLAISVDGSALALAFVAVPVIKWLRQRSERAWLVATLQALAAGSAALVAAKSGIGLATGCGALSPALAAGFAWAALVVWTVSALEPHPRSFTLVGFLVAAAGAWFIADALGTGCAAGQPLGMTRILPLWWGGPTFVLQAIGLPLLGFFAAVRMIGPANDWLRRWWIDYALLLGLAILLAVFDIRVAAAACALAAVPLGWQVREWTRAARNARRHGRRALALAGVAVAIAPALPLSLVLMATPTQASAVAR